MRPGLALPLLLVIAPHLGMAAEPSAIGHYDTPPDCPAQDEWTARLDRAAANALHVRIERRPEKGNASEYHGVLHADGSEEARTVRGTSCREVFEALVLVAKLSFDAASSDLPRSTSTSITDAPPPAESTRRIAPLR